MKKLHLCCGDRYLEGYVNIDCDGLYRRTIHPDFFKSHVHIVTLDNYYKECKIGDQNITIVDEIYDLKNDLPYENDSIEEIVMISAIEHFNKIEAKILIGKLYYFLKKGGKLLIDFPDIEATVKKYLDKDPEYMIRLIYCNHKDEQSIHHWGYTQETFSKILNPYNENTKFNIKWRDIVKHDYPMIGCEATKI